MRRTASRIAPVSDAELTSEQAEALDPYRSSNLFRTLAHAPKALSLFKRWAEYFWDGGSWARAREIVILRTGFLCKSGYEWAHHVLVATREGLAEEEITRIKQGAGAGWRPADAVLIQATDELHRDCYIADATWEELRRHYSEKQCIDVVLTVGAYTQVSMLLNAVGVQLEEGRGLTLDPDLTSI